jgi:carbamoyltransferase
MGLAGYGEPREEIYDFFRSHTVVDGLHLELTLPRRAKGRRESFFDRFAALERFYRRPDDPDVMRAADLAHNFQRYFCDVVSELVHNAGELGLSRHLAYAGGCALNSAANGVLLDKSRFERLHVPCAPADDGNSLGAALYEKYFVRGAPRVPRTMSPYLGSTLDLDTLERILRYRGIHARKLDEEELCREAAARLADGQILGWLQGRAEFGPRALGNRSILADARVRDMKDQINRRVKFREEYRPLGPAILHEHGPDYFEGYQESPYMERALRFRPAVRDEVPAAVHVDGTGRLQSVGKDTNPLFHALVCAFQDLTGVPLLVNTSFNVMGKPIVHGVADAITVFYTTDLDAMAIGPYLVTKD